MKTAIKLLLISIFAIAVTLTANAHDKKKQGKGHGDHSTQTTKTKGEFLGKGDGVETCPVTGEKIENKDVKAVFYDRTIYFCCAGCVDDVKKNPAAYIKKTHKEQLAAIKDLPKSEGHHNHHGESKQDEQKGDQKFLGKGDGVETCPVTGEPVNKNLKGDADGQVFYVCCEGCLETVKKNPGLYLKKAGNK